MEGDTLALQIAYKGGALEGVPEAVSANEFIVRIAANESVLSLKQEIERITDVPAETQKLIMPKLFLRSAHDQQRLRDVLPADVLRAYSGGAPGTAKKPKITLIGTRINLAFKIAETKSENVERTYINEFKPSAAARSRETLEEQRADKEYCFEKIEPLSFLPQKERSLEILQRLAAEPGIRAIMRKHKFRVGLLTELDPATNTSMTSKCLGLNTNHGQKIELRLRTDSYDGWRDYKTIRSTLCHELAHNVHGDHDRAFHDLWNTLEREADRLNVFHADSGHRLTSQEFYQPPESDSRDGETARAQMAQAAEKRRLQEREGQ
ncbi:WLM domain-containing protein [Dipodascopsis tothii]|uniref:WLM domain-containing protein n=1 Tax=Dipodascopsis tothii TaxID=44089 RepID=UPI0034CE8EE8